jgi:hypothetical protein
MAPLMAALVIEVGLLGMLCGKFIRPAWLMWLLYGWIWLVMDITVVPLAMQDVGPWETISADTLPAALLSAQLGLVIVWAILGQARWSTRLPAALVLATAVLAPLVWHRIRPTELLIMILVQMLLLGAVCALLFVFRYRLVIAKSETASGLEDTELPRPSGLTQAQFQIRDVLLWTTALGIVLATARAAGYWVASLEVWQNVQAGLRNRGVLVLLLPTPTAAILTAMVLLLALWSALGAGRAVVRWPIMAVFTLGVGLTSSLLDYHVMTAGWRPRPIIWDPGVWSWVWFYKWSNVAWFCLSGGMLFASLLLLRTLGYRLGRKKAATE